LLFLKTFLGVILNNEGTKMYILEDYAPFQSTEIVVFDPETKSFPVYYDT